MSPTETGVPLRPNKEAICGAMGPLIVEGSPLFICVLRPDHKGKHNCHVDCSWPEDAILREGSVMLTIRFGVNKAKQRRIALAFEEAKDSSKEHSV